MKYLTRGTYLDGMEYVRFIDIHGNPVAVQLEESLREALFPDNGLYLIITPAMLDKYANDCMIAASQPFKPAVVNE